MKRFIILFVLVTASLFIIGCEDGENGENGKNGVSGLTGPSGYEVLKAELSLTDAEMNNLAAELTRIGKGTSLQDTLDNLTDAQIDELKAKINTDTQLTDAELKAYIDANCVQDASGTGITCTNP